MTHYHGSPFGGSGINAAQFYAGRHGFVPFPNPGNLGVIADVCQSFALDNGAFTIWRRGDGRIDYDAYVEWVRKWHRHPAFDWAIIPDVIEGSVAENDAWVDRWPKDVRGVPVWHVDEPVERLRRLCDDWHTVALGSAGEYSTPGSGIWWERMKVVMDQITDEQGRPPAQLHGLRMLDPEVFTRLPLASADSVNAARNANQEGRFGSYVPPSSGQRADVIASRIEAHQSAPRWTRVDQAEMFTLNGEA